MADSKLPEMIGHMPIVQGIFIEVLRLLVEEGIVSEEAAVRKYNEQLAVRNGWVKV